MRFIVVALVCASCDRTPSPPQIVPGERVGAIAIGMRWSEVRALIGNPSSDPSVAVRLGHAYWRELGLDVVFTSPDETAATDDALVIGVGTSSSATRDTIEREFGAPTEQFDGHAYYGSGLGITYGDDSIADRIAVFASTDTLRKGVAAMPPRATGVVIDGQPIAAVDMHLHPGEYGSMAPEGKAYIAANLPPDLVVYAPDLLDRLSDPWAEHVGIAEQTALAGVDHAVLFAVYAPHSTGVFSNESLLAVLADPRNIAADGRPWAWGLASINFEGWTPDVAAQRLSDLRQLLATHANRLIGIKLAHAHQGVRLDDPNYFGIYDLAVEAGVPVLLHTGFSPFPGTHDEPDYYDPAHLEAVLEKYPTLDVVLSHIGQGDARAIRHALDLAATHDHIWLELSALGRPLLVDENGASVATLEPQYPMVLAEIRQRGLIGRTLFATDGPQYSGAIRSYLGRIVSGMQSAGYSTAEIQAVLAGNFAKLFTRTAVEK